MAKYTENKKLTAEQTNNVSGGCPLPPTEVMKPPEAPPPIPGPSESPPIDIVR